MTLEFNIIGIEEFPFAGTSRQTGINSYSVQLDSLPTAPGGASSVGQTTLNIDELLVNGEPFDPVFLQNVRIDTTNSFVASFPANQAPEILTDQNFLQTVGVISTVNTDESTTLSFPHRANLLNIDLTIPPFEGTVPEYFQFLLGTAGADSVGIEEGTSRTWPTKSFAGQRVNGWDHFKDLCFLENIDTYIVSYNSSLFSVFIFERLRWSIPTDGFHNPLNESVSRYNPSKYVEVVHYNNLWVDSGELYPANNEDATIIQVDASQLLELEVPLRGTAATLNQPEVVDWVEADPDYYDGTDGVYAVVGSDGLPVTAAQWTAQGGSLTVAVKEDDPSTAIVTVRGGSDENLSPYSIAMSSGNNYNALRITGDGTRSYAKTIRFATGADPATAPQELGETYSNPLVSTKTDAIRAAAAIAARNNGISHELDQITVDHVVVTGPSITFTPSYMTPMMLSSSTFDFRDGVWRLTSTSVGPDEFTSAAENVTNLGHLNDRLGDEFTLGDWNDVWGDDANLQQLALRPLRSV